MQSLFFYLCIRLAADMINKLTQPRQNTNMPGNIKIIPFETEYQNQIAALIPGIQNGEFGLPLTIADQPDLLQIPSFYQSGKSNFWIALDGNQVVGTIALLVLDDKNAALRKMFVKKEYRSTGTAKQLMDTLLSFAKANGLQHVYLGTVDVFQAALRFYEKCGFKKIDKENLPAIFPLMPLDNHFYQYTFDEHTKK